MWLALLSTALPLALGAWWGRRVPGARGWGAWAVAWVAGVSLTLWWQALAPGEVVWLALSFGLGSLLGQVHPPLAGVAAAVLFLAATEVLAWRGLGPPESRPGDLERWRVPLTALSPPCTWDSATASAPRKVDDGRPLVVHLGDSMIDNFGVSSREAVVGRLIRREPHIRHVEAGHAGTGPDCAWRILRDGPDAALWVLHSYLGNDVEDLKGGYAWCGDRALTDLALPPSLVCDATPRWLSPAARLATTAPPLVLRHLASTSATAHHLARAVDDLALRQRQRRALERVPPHGLESVYVGVIQQMVEDAKRRGGAFHVTLTPLRATHPAATHERADRIGKQLRGLDVPVWDGRVAFPPTHPRWFLTDDPHDPHLSPDGHDRWAAWLLASGAVEAPPRAAAPDGPEP